MDRREQRSPRTAYWPKAVAITTIGAFVVGVLTLIVQVLQNDTPSSTSPAQPQSSISGESYTPTTARTFPSTIVPSSTDPIPTKTVRPPSEVGDVPGAFIGSFKGIVSQPDSPSYKKYPVTMTITGGELGDPIGHTTYGLLGCNGVLKLIDFSRNRIVVEEEPDTLNCAVATITLIRRDHDQLSYSFRDGAGLATLRRIES